MSDNPVLSARIRSMTAQPEQDEWTLAAERERHAAQRADDSVEMLTKMLRDAGEPAPTVRRIMSGLLGETASADVAGYPVTLKVSSYHAPQMALLPIGATTTRDALTFTTVEQLGVYGDPALYATPDEFEALNPDHPESPWYHVSVIGARRAQLLEEEEDAAARAAVDKALTDARAAQREWLSAQLTPLQFELATSLTLTGLPYFEWLVGLCAGQSAATSTEVTSAVTLALNTIRAARPDHSA